MRKSDLLNRIRGGTCAVLGYGVSNRPLVEWLIAHGARSVTVHDKRTPEAMERDGDAARLARLAEKGVALVCGDGYLDGLEGDIIFRSPGFRPDLPAIRTAVAAGAVLSSEMELFLSLTEATVIGLSGSDGKTTTTTLTARILEAACRRTGKGRVYLGGNIGTPLLPLVEDMTADDFAVVELSSFQLMTMGGEAGVNRAVLTNISPNHLNWHTDMDEYVRAKSRLLREDCHDGVPQLRVLNFHNAYTRAMEPPPGIPLVWFSASGSDWVHAAVRDADCRAAVYEQDGRIRITDGDHQTAVLDVSRIRLPGRHNVENYMAAIGVTCVHLRNAPPLATPADVQAVADSFTGVPHRLELIRQRGDIRYYNGSIDSSPTRTVAALNAIREMNEREGRRAPIVICGGQDKHIPFDPLAVALCHMASAVVLTGEARDQILTALQRCPDYDPDQLPVTVIPDYRTAMQTACEMAGEGDTVLLSPACTSFDAFRNFEERGNAFREIVMGL